MNCEVACTCQMAEIWEKITNIHQMTAFAVDMLIDLQPIAPPPIPFTTLLPHTQTFLSAYNPLVTAPSHFYPLLLHCSPTPLTWNAPASPSWLPDTPPIYPPIDMSGPLASYMQDEPYFNCEEGACDQSIECLQATIPPNKSTLEELLEKVAIEEMVADFRQLA